MTILNETGRIWTLVAGGGASVIFADTIVELGGVKELANYGEYSGGPNEEQTYAYARTVIDLMCKHKHPEGKVKFIDSEKATKFCEISTLYLTGTTSGCHIDAI